MRRKDYLRRTFLSLTVALTCTLLSAQQQNDVGSGYTIAFDGVDDYIDLGDIYDDLELPLTISAWIYQEQGLTVQNPIFASQDNAALYNGFWFCVNANNVFVGYGDGKGENNPAFRREKSAVLPSPRNRWIHVAALVKSGTEMELYVNGVNAGGVLNGTSSFPMASTFPGDVAKIGSFYTNSVTHRFKGKIDELKIFNRALSDSEIKDAMCRKAKGNEAGLIGYWTFDETSGTILKDKSSRNFDGQVMGSPIREYSAAPIGDESIHLYTSNWVEQSLIIDDFAVSDVSGSPIGIHMYKINETPSQTGGLASQPVQSRYYGVFVADNFSGKTFKLENACDVYGREDNSVAVWGEIDIDQPIANRIEILGDRRVSLELNVGSDTVICNQVSFLIQSNFTDAPGRSFLWSTGEAGPDIFVTQSGEYVLELTEGCSFGVDTVDVTFEQDPAEFTLGGDIQVCPAQEFLLRPYMQPAAGYDFTWQDGSKDSEYIAKDFGTFWVQVQNLCGKEADTVTIFKIEQEIPLDLGRDSVLCLKEPIILTPIDNPSGMDYIWQDGSRQSSYLVESYGRFWVTVTSDCGSASDTIEFARRRFEFQSVPNVITPNGDDVNDVFLLEGVVTPEPSIEIFNRWGKKVFESSSYKNNWPAQDLGAGVYFYMLSLGCISNIKGIIHVIK